MSNSSWTKQLVEIFHKKSYSSLFVIQFGGALNDNVLRNALIAMIIFGVLSTDAAQRGLMVQATLGLFMLPFFLFSATAGRFADSCPDYAIAIRFIKAAEIFTVAIAMVGLAIGNFWLLLFSVFVAGMQSAYFGPFKYAIIPKILNRNELISGNALFSASTYVAILCGIYWGTKLGAEPNNDLIVSLLLVAIAVIGFGAAILMPSMPTNTNTSWSKALSWNIFYATYATVRISKATKGMLPLIMLISWFWASGAVISAQLPLIVRDAAGFDENAYLLLLVVVCLGIATGSMISSRALRNNISPKLISMAIGLAAFGCLMPAIPLNEVIDDPTKLGTLAMFINDSSNYGLIIMLLGVSIAMGFFIVPLYVLLQLLAPKNQRGQMVACNNIFNAAFIVAGVLIAATIVASNELPAQGLQNLFAAVGYCGFVVAGLANYVLKKIVVQVANIS